MADDLEIGDSRVEFIAVYLIKTLKLKADKWMKMYAVEESKIMIHDFLDKTDNNLLVFALNNAQALVVTNAYPNQLKAKACYFTKKNREPITKDMNIKDALLYGDLSYAPLDQLSAILDEVKFHFYSKKIFFVVFVLYRSYNLTLSLKLLVPVFSNPQNQNEWPKVISNDLIRHINNLKNKTYVISGQMKGKTQLPIPSGAEKVNDDDLKTAESGENVDQSLIHSIESVVIDWSHQIQDVLKKDSSQPLLDGLNPGPMVEVEFWKAKAANLENIYDQVCFFLFFLLTYRSK